MRLSAVLTRISSLVTIAWSLAVGGGALASDCIYPSSTLQQNYARSDAIVVAMVTGCADGVLPHNGGCANQNYSLDVMEVIKDSMPSRDHGGIYVGHSAMGCGMTYRTGHTYLLFLDKTGNPNPGASGDLSGEPLLSKRTNEQLQALRDYRDGKTGDLSGPWQFMDTGTSCHAGHRMAGATLSFSYTYSRYDYHQNRRLIPSTGPNGESRLDTDPQTPENESLHAARIGPDYPRDAVVFSTELTERFQAKPGSVEVRAGNQVWPLQRQTVTVQFGFMMPEEYRIPISNDVTYGDAAIDILNAMNQPTDVRISALPAAIGPQPLTEVPAVFTTRTTRFAEAARRFKACVDGSDRQANPALP